jgi:myosin heavy subunit
MPQVCRALLVCLVSVVLAGILRGQVEDPSDIFVKAYLSAQQGEKLEQEERFKTAVAKYRFAGSLIEELRRSHPNWQPAIVEYRGRKIGEGILRIQERISRQNELRAAASPLPELVPSLPETDGWSEPGPEVVAPQEFDTMSQESSEATTKKLQRKVDQLDAALEKSRRDLATARKEKDALNTRLGETSSKLKNTQKEIEKSKESGNKSRDQLAQTQASLTALQAAQENSTQEQQQSRAQIADLKNAVAVAEKARERAEKQREETNAKLAEANQQIAAVKQQRDDALAQLKVEGNTEQHTQARLVQNDDLMGVKQQVAQLQQQLADSQKRNQYLVARIAELSVALDETGVQLQNANLTGKNSEEADRLLRENELLRNIVVREREEEARRDEARKLMLAEVNRLKIKSDALTKQIEFLAQPVTKLTSEELSLLRQPVVSVSDQNRGVLSASFIFAKESTGGSVEGEATMNNSGGVKEDVGDGAQGVVRAATKSFSDADIERLKPMPGNPQGSE